MGKSGGKLFKYAMIIGGIVLLTISVIILILAIQSATLDQRIAQFEAKRKIPDSENAAVIYERMFTDVNFTSVFSDNIFKEIKFADTRKPWTNEKRLEVSEWLRNRQNIIEDLLKVSKLEKCYFPLPTDLNESWINRNNLIFFRNMAHLMTYSAKNDVSEGRINDAIEKYQFLLIMSSHLCQQPLLITYLVGFGCEGFGLRETKNLILNNEISEDNLNAIDIFPLHTKDVWKDQFPQVLEGDNLSSLKVGNYSLFMRLKTMFSQIRLKKDFLQNIHNMYLRILTDNRSIRIAIGLRRFKNQNGKWPESLEQIKPLVDPNDLIDPWNNSSLVYKLTDDGFTLYSRGPNNIDEGGKYESDNQGKIITDDWPIWPEKR